MRTDQSKLFVIYVIIGTQESAASLANTHFVVSEPEPLDRIIRLQVRSDGRVDCRTMLDARGLVPAFPYCRCAAWTFVGDAPPSTREVPCLRLPPNASSSGEREAPCLFSVVWPDARGPVPASGSICLEQRWACRVHCLSPSLKSNYIYFQASIRTPKDAL